MTVKGEPGSGTAALRREVEGAAGGAAPAPHPTPPHPERRPEQLCMGAGRGVRCAGRGARWAAGRRAAVSVGSWARLDGGSQAREQAPSAAFREVPSAGNAARPAGRGAGRGAAGTRLPVPAGADPMRAQSVETCPLIRKGLCFVFQ